MANEKVTDQYQQVAAILREIAQGKKVKDVAQSYDCDQLKVHKFRGEIGPDVTFQEEHREYAPQVDTTRVDLAYKGRDLGKITAIHKVTRKNFRTLRDFTSISVVSPKWQEDKARVVKESHTTKAFLVDEKITSLSFYPGDDETANEMVDRITAAIAKSKDRRALFHKLSKLNLPSNVTIKNPSVLVDKIMDHIHGADDLEK